MAGLTKRGKTWYAVLRENGVERRISLKTSSIARAREKLVDMEREVGNQGGVALDMTVQDFQPMLENHIAATRSPHTAKTLLHEWKHCKAWAKPVKLSDVTNKMVLDYRNQMITDGYAPSTIRTTVAELGSIFKIAIKELGILTGPNPTYGIPVLKTDEEIPRFLSLDEIAKVIAAAEAWGSDLHMAVGLGVYAGLRYNEIVNALWTWVDFDQGHGAILV